MMCYQRWQTDSRVGFGFGFEWVGFGFVGFEWVGFGFVGFIRGGKRTIGFGFGFEWVEFFFHPLNCLVIFIEKKIFNIVHNKIIMQRYQNIKLRRRKLSSST
jgi:hypothetical protein